MGKYLLVGNCVNLYERLDFCINRDALESVYDKALLTALRQKGLKTVAQVPIEVTLRGEAIQSLNNADFTIKYPVYSEDHC